MSAASTLDKLRERKVIQWALAYVAAAWVIAQVVEVLAEPWGLPLAWVRALHVVLVGGLPIAVTIAWYHGERGLQRVMRSEAALLGLIVAGTAYALFSLDLRESARSPATSAPPRAGLIEISDSIPRLAVLAFANLGAPVDSFLADGITAELGSRLSGLRGLALLSPSSAKAFRGSGQTPREVGLALNADYVLFGNVLWNRDPGGSASVRVLPEMIRVTDNTQVWSAQLDRPFENALAVQAEIALEVVKQLRVTLTGPERSALGERPTDNALAYEAYLKGIQVLPDGHGAEEHFRQARLLLVQATTLDPQFLEAWTALAQADFGLYWFGYDTRPDRLEMGLESVNRALAIDSDSEDARLAMGQYHYRRREWDAALAQYSAAYRSRPNDARVLASLGYLWRRQGLIEQGVEALERSSGLDPLNAYLIAEIAYTHLILGHDQQARELIRKAQAVNPEEDWAYLGGVLVCWTMSGPEAVECGREELLRFPHALSTYPTWFWVLQLLFEGRPEEALARIENYPDPALVMQSVYLPVEFVRGMLLQANGREDEGYGALQEAAEILRREIEKNPDDVRLFLGLGETLAHLGEREEAIRLAEKSLEMMPRDEDALRWQDVTYAVTGIFAVLGEDRRALDSMAELLSGPTAYRGAWWSRHPAFASLREHPRFIALLEASGS